MTRKEHNAAHGVNRQPDESVSCNLFGYGELSQYDGDCPAWHFALTALDWPHNWPSTFFSVCVQMFVTFRSKPGRLSLSRAPTGTLSCTS